MVSDVNLHPYIMGGSTNPWARMTTDRGGTVMPKDYEYVDATEVGGKALEVTQDDDGVGEQKIEGKNKEQKDVVD